MQTLMLVSGWIVAVLIGAFGLIILWKMATDKINLEHLISEDNKHASLSRFQFLVFTFVIAMSLFLITLAGDGVTRPAFPPDIPDGILALLGISAGSYVISKGIQKGTEQKKDPEEKKKK